MGVSTHILDTARGVPAREVPVSLARQIGGNWQVLRTDKTDVDGRCRQLLSESESLDLGYYRVRFETSAYYAAQQIAGLYPYVEIVFEVRDAEQHFHIPLLLTANGYTTYRGS
jgi:5-hydroxyisourate hydrolase